MCMFSVLWMCGLASVVLCCVSGWHDVQVQLCNLNTTLKNVQKILPLHTEFVLFWNLPCLRCSEPISAFVAVFQTRFMTTRCTGLLDLYHSWTVVLILCLTPDGNKSYSRLARHAKSKTTIELFALWWNCFEFEAELNLMIAICCVSCCLLKFAIYIFLTHMLISLYVREMTLFYKRWCVVWRQRCIEAEV